ncbi:hypothetical protein KBY23_10955 [Ruegeria pomeroyi]|nr:hypothetical protein [Ruegeria pomeroyi]
MEPSFLKGQIIRFETFDMPGPPPVPIVLTYKNQGWADVIRRLADLQVDKWDGEYFDPSIMDGSGWSLTVRSPRLNTHSEGLNAYPPNFDAVRDIIERAATNAPAQKRTSYARKPRKCPNCGAAPVASILYGMPNLSSKLMEKERRGEVVFGGCVIEMDGSQPVWKCTTCEMEFFKAT